jgi:hypothetical protein
MCAGNPRASQTQTSTRGVGHFTSDSPIHLHERMGGIVNKPQSSHSSTCGDCITEPETSRNQFFREHSKVLSSKRIGNIHPELRKLRLVLGCEYGRPKLIQYLTRTTQIQGLFEDENNSLQSLESAFMFNHFIAKFHISVIPSSDGPIGGIEDKNSRVDLRSYFAQIVVLTAISGFHNFLSSTEYADWLRYQTLLNESRSGSNNNSFRSESLRSISRLSSHHLATEIQNADYAKLLNKSHWIVALAHVLEDLPYPVSLLGKNKEPSSVCKPAISPSIVSFPSTHQHTTDAVPSPTMVLFGNSAFVEMVGYTREEIAQHHYDHYHRPSSSEAETEAGLAISDAIHFGSSLKIGTMCHPQAPLPPLLDLQSYLPLYDPERRCHYILVLHCDIWKHHQHSEYLQRLDILTDMLSQAVLPHRDHESTFLKAHFYSNHKSSSSQIKPHPTHSLSVGMSTISNSCSHGSFLTDSSPLETLQVHYERGHRSNDLAEPSPLEM